MAGRLCLRDFYKNQSIENKYPVSRNSSFCKNKAHLLLY